MAKTGRPKKEFDWGLLNKVLQYKTSLSDTAEIMKCSEDLIQINIKKESGITFSAYRDKKQAPVRLTLTQKAIQMAKAGDRTMLIFCLKNYCGWSDNPGNEEENNRAININYNVIKKKVDELVKK